MKSEKIFMVTALFIIFMLISCKNNQRALVESYNVETETVNEIKPADFNLWADWFSNFDPRHIYNFHYVIVTDHHSRVPGPTDDRIEGFFNISEEEWGNYVNEDTRWEKPWDVELNSVNNATDIFEIEANEFSWVRSTNWNIKHRGERVAGSLLACKDNRLIWFSLAR